ncbi:MAG: DNA polymerase III subunit delta [Nitrospinota bacterium]
MSYDSVLIQIQKGAISPVYMLYGKEDYLKKELLKALQGKLGLTDNNNLSLDNIDARETTGASIVEKAETFPFLSEKRLVIVHGIDANPKLEAGTALASYLSSPSPFTCLVSLHVKLIKEKSFSV